MAPRSRPSILNRGELPQDSERLLDLPEIRSDNFDEIFGDTTEAILQFLARYKLIKNEIVCERVEECGGIVALSKDKKLQDGFMWRCTGCRGTQSDKRYSVRTDSFFFDHKLPIKQELLIMESWCNHPEIGEDVVAKNAEMHKITVSNYFELFRDITATWYERNKMGRLILCEEPIVKQKQTARTMYGIKESNLHGFMTEKCFRDYCKGEKIMNNLLHQIALICNLKKPEFLPTIVKSEPNCEEIKQEIEESFTIPEVENNDNRFLEFIRMPSGRSRVCILDVGEEPQSPSRLLDLPDIREENIDEITGISVDEVLQFLARYKLIRNTIKCENNCGGAVGLSKSKKEKDGYNWRCTRCRGTSSDKRHSVRTHSFFFDHKVPIKQELLIMEAWCNHPEMAVDAVAKKIEVHKSSIANYYSLFRDIAAVWMENTLEPAQKRMKMEEPTGKTRQNARFLYGIRESKGEGFLAEQRFREYCKGGKVMNEFLRQIAEICNFEKMDLEKMEAKMEPNFEENGEAELDLSVFLKQEVDEEIGTTGGNEILNTIAFGTIFVKEEEEYTE